MHKDVSPHGANTVAVAVAGGVVAICGALTALTVVTVSSVPVTVAIVGALSLLIIGAGVVIGLQLSRRSR
ncbi:MAG: hypothetical protein HGA44_04550 [Cellulomonadaceae bacterium]|nr:hypothetical protein [Cellulomonadaceae bacterium]